MQPPRLNAAARRLLDQLSDENAAFVVSFAYDLARQQGQRPPSMSRLLTPLQRAIYRETMIKR